MRYQPLTLVDASLNIDYEIERNVIWGLNSSMHEYNMHIICSIVRMYAGSSEHVLLPARLETCISRKFDD